METLRCFAASSAVNHVRGSDFIPICLPCALSRKFFALTCVGKTGTASATGTTPTEHPHMRGEDWHCQCYRHHTNGTPPHAWGRPNPNRWRQLLCRNTPTCVGKTPTRRSIHSPSEEHPHMRGEDQTLTDGGNCYVGTPPHAWGRRGWRGPVNRPRRNTPTCVGKTPP